MIISEKGLELIKKYEGVMLQSYDDYNDKPVSKDDEVVGTLTIGYGHTGDDVYKGQVITLEEAEQMLKCDMLHYSSEVEEVVRQGIITFELSQNMFDALVSFDYNLGQGNLIKLCQGRDKETVADKMLLYNNAGSVWEEGLTKRREAERELFLCDDETQQIDNVSRETISCNYEIQRLQHELNLQGFKDMNGNELSEDGQGGALTISACPIIKKGCQGYITQWVQLRVGADADCIFGDMTQNAVTGFQSLNKLEPDGIVGKNTWSKFFELM